MLFLGIDVGSSSVKLAVLDGSTGSAVAATQFPKRELEIQSPKAGWAEQDPEVWWQCVKSGCAELFERFTIDPSAIAGVGITYQMHGLVLVDAQQKVLRPAIIWCDSRAVATGDEALGALGADYCYEHLLNSPGNFTAAKLRWVQQHEPEVYARIDKIMLPGDYIAMRLSGQVTTTAGGLSEGVFWDFKQNQVGSALLNLWDINPALLPSITPEIGEQCQLSAEGAASLGLKAGIPVAYRAGDQPNNAFSLNVLNPGDVAATAGTSGVIYGVTDKPLADTQGRVNTFRHVTHTDTAPRNGVLVCVNGSGRSYSWLRELLSHHQASNNEAFSYPLLNEFAAKAPIGCEGLSYLPFGNGAERIFNNRNLGAHLRNIDLNRHGLPHIARAVQEGIVFAMNTGFDVLKGLGGDCKTVKAPSGNLFLSPIFQEAFANTTQCAVELLDTDSAEGAARGAALGCGYFNSHDEAFTGIKSLQVIEPQTSKISQYQDAYQCWQQTI